MTHPNPCHNGHLNQEPGMSARLTPGVFPLFDARGIFCGNVCDRCEQWKRAQYRVEVFDDPNYETDEPIEPEAYFGSRDEEL